MSTSEEKMSFWHCNMITNGQELSAALIKQGKKAFYMTYHIYTQGHDQECQ